MADALPITHQIWLRSFYGFDPENDGYIGWTSEGSRDRMLGLIKDQDLFIIYGAASAQTTKKQRNVILGFIQVTPLAIRDSDKASDAGMSRKRGHGWSDKWTYAIPIVRAWRTSELVRIERIAIQTYRPAHGRAIAQWNPPLLPDEVERALKIKVFEVSVFGEPPVVRTSEHPLALGQVFKPSRGVPGSFGERTSQYQDGPTVLYLARFDGDRAALLGPSSRFLAKTVLIKIGITNDVIRRTAELNDGFPPAAKGKWKMDLVSKPFPDREKAEIAEHEFKQRAEVELQSLGREFFQGELIKAQLIFAGISGVSTFGN